MIKITTSLCICILGLMLGSCDKQEEPKKETPKQIKMARAVLTPLEGNHVYGVVTFTTVPEGVRIVAKLDGLKLGLHGLHVHEHGDCSAHDGSSTGGHFNPTNKKHGHPDEEERHVGDLGNIKANEDGHAYYDRIDKVISLNGENSIVGRSLVVHAGTDDYTTQPAGNSGAKVACGKIEELNFEK